MALNKQEVKDRVVPIISKYLNIDKSEIDLNTHLEDYGMNSILALRILDEITRIYPNFQNPIFGSVNQIVDEIVQNS